MASTVPGDTAAIVVLRRIVVVIAPWGMFASLPGGWGPTGIERMTDPGGMLDLGGILWIAVQHLSYIVPGGIVLGIFGSSRDILPLRFLVVVVGLAVVGIALLVGI